MQRKLLVVLFMLALSFIVKAEEKSYIRDRSECTFNKEKLVLEIKSPNLYADSHEFEYGDTIALKHNGESKTIMMNESAIGRYRILSLYNDICSKVMALPIKKDELAFLLMKDNRPFHDQLTILYYNVKSRQTEVVATKISVKSAFLKDQKVYLRHAKDQPDQKFGTLILEDVKYNFVEKPFEPWVSFDGRHFRTDHEMSYERFEYKHLLDHETFKKYKQLNKLTYRLATHGKRSCLSFEKSNWKCK